MERSFNRNHDNNDRYHDRDRGSYHNDRVRDERGREDRIRDKDRNNNNNNNKIHSRSRSREREPYNKDIRYRGNNKELDSNKSRERENDSYFNRDNKKRDTTNDEKLNSKNNNNNNNNNGLGSGKENNISNKLSTKHAKNNEIEDGEEKEVYKKQDYIDENNQKEIDLFLSSTSNDSDDEFGLLNEEKEAEKLAIERKKRREEILNKYNEQEKIKPIQGNKDIENIEEDDYKLLTSPDVKRTSFASDAVAAMTISDYNLVDASSTTILYRTIDNNVPDNDEAANIITEKKIVNDEINNNGFEFDMFSSSPSYLEKSGIQGGGRRALRTQLLEGEDPHLQSNWDDGEGYYRARIGEVIGERYQTLGVVGKGVFSTVLKCLDLHSCSEVSTEVTSVAIKLIRNNDTMRKAADKEKAILINISDKDPENKKFCVRLLATLDYRSHVAMVFEYQQMNLREALKKFGKDVGINITAVRIYARQLLVALRHLADLRIVHADIKLDNILCSGDLKQVKLCDFGSAFRETDSDNDPTPYLVSRFYRAPEIILGMQYDRCIDLWSVAVCLYELFTGHVMFPGRFNNEMLKLMMNVKGRFSNKMIKTHIRSYESLALEPHFEADMKFKQLELDPITGKSNMRLVDITQPTKDLTATIRSAKAGGDDTKLVISLTDLLEKCLILDPTKRMIVTDAIKHPFFSLK